MENQRLYLLSSQDASSSLSGASFRSSKIPQKIEHPDRPDVADYVPLYSGEIRKDALKCKPNKPKRRNKISSTIFLDKSNSEVPLLPTCTSTKSRASLVSTDSLNSILEAKPKKSYLNMFHAKIGYIVGNANKEGGDTNRAVCDDYSTARSSVDVDCDFMDAQSFVSDTSSFYNKFMDDGDQSDEIPFYNEIKHLASKMSLSDSAIAKLKSVSEMSINTVSNSKRLTKKHTNTRKSCTATPEVPLLGGLGHDREAVREKLQKLKRQQSYGQKVSNRNRIKMLEMQVVKNLKIELKKSEELNKCTETVLNT